MKPRVLVFVSLLVVFSLMLIGCSTKSENGAVNENKDNSQESTENVNKSEEAKDKGKEEKEEIKVPETDNKKEEEKTSDTPAEENEKETVEKPNEDITGSDSPVSIHWAEEELKNFKQHDEFTADTSEGQVELLFSTKRDVKDFKVLKLEMQDVDEDGVVSYKTEEIHEQDVFKSDRPLVVKMTFFGDLPTYGISFVDDAGVTRKFAIGMSGRDGSLLLYDF